MGNMYYQYIDSPVGKLLAAGTEKGLCVLSPIHELQADWEEKETEVLILLKTQLQEYFCKTRKVFAVPLSPSGTEFQKCIWAELLKIPYGETRTYGEIAAAAGNSKASRAVGMANHNNPIMILIPCHRVIGSNGKLTGYAGGLEMKEYLLELEKKVTE